MRDGRDILRNHFGDRFLTPIRLWEYAYNLQLVDISMRADLLEFLERERLLVPICRIRYPAEIVRIWHANDLPDWKDPDLPVETSEERLDAATELYHGTHGWGPTPDGGIRYHPLDLLKSEHSEFVESEVDSRAFQPWEAFVIVVGKDGLTDSSAVETYYRYWQAFLFAEILSTAIPILVNFQDSAASRLVFERRFADIPSGKLFYLPMSLPGRQVLKEFREHEACFEAVAFFRAYRDFSLKACAGDQAGTGVRLTGERLDEYLRLRKGIAHQATWRWNLSGSELLAFIKWQCARWGNWNRLGRSRLCDDYARNIIGTILLYRLITGKEYRELVEEVGSVTSHFRQTLDVIFPDWFQETAEPGGSVIEEMDRTHNCGLPNGRVRDVARGLQGLHGLDLCREPSAGTPVLCEVGRSSSGG